MHHSEANKKNLGRGHSLRRLDTRAFGAAFDARRLAYPTSKTLRRLCTEDNSKIPSILKGSPWNLVSAQGVPNASMMGLPDGRKSFKIGLVVLIQYRL